VELNAILSKTDTALTKGFIKAQVDVAKQELDKTESELERFKEKAQLVVLKKKIEILLSRKGEIEMELSHAKVAIGMNEERLKKTEEEFQKSDKTIKITSKLVENPLYLQSLAQLSDSDVKKIFNLNMEVEQANPIYGHLETKIVDLRPNLSSLYAKQDYLQPELKKNTSELNKLQIELINKEMELQRLHRAYKLANVAYELFVKKFQKATLDVASRTQELKILDPAVIPDEPIKPKKRLIVIIAGMVGLIFSLSMAFILEYFGKVKEREQDT